MSELADTAAPRPPLCPFCGFVCSNLGLERTEGGFRVQGVICPAGRAGFEFPPGDDQALVDGAPVAQADAIDRAAAILGAARLPVFGGLGADVDGLRAVVDLADRTGGVVDHAASDGLMRNTRVVQDTGWIVTTLTEVRNRADLILLVGRDFLPRFPQFLDRCAPTVGRLAADGPPAIFRLGPPADTVQDRVATVACPADGLVSAVAALHLAAQGRAMPPVAGVDPAALAALASRLAAAHYAVIGWHAGDFADPWAALLVETIADLLRQLTLTTRAAGLPFGGASNLIGANQVTTWQAGLPLRLSFATGVPVHDPILFSAARLLAAGEADALFWVAALEDTVPPPGVPTIVLGRPGGQAGRRATVFLPVGTPGLDYPGQVFRMDGVVALGLDAQRPSALPDAASVVRAIASRLVLAGARA
jgi:formylmethanofuran dehydrogenase subunit B